MKVALDLDGVLADFVGQVHTKYQEWFDKEPAHDMRVYDSILGLLGGGPRFWQWVDQVPGFWRDIPLYPGAAGFLYRCHEAGWGVQLVTARHKNAEAQTREWVERVFPSAMRLTPVHFTAQKWVTEASVYVDDTPGVLQALVEQRRPTIRFARPWNRNVPGTLTVSTYNELFEMLVKMAANSLDWATEQIRLVDEFLDDGRVDVS